MEYKMKIDNVQQNKHIHNKLYKTYNLKHSEIYNDYEQERLKKTIFKIIKKVKKKEIKVLDVGAGTGNLSLKFLEFECKVTASDVSKKSLELLKKLSNNNSNLSIKLINDENLPFQDDSFDIVSAYSVLHHIPDYLNTIKEMIRVTKKGGLIYIDHEANKNRYFPNKYLKDYYKITKQTRLEHLKKLIKTKELFTYDFFKSAFIISFINKKYRREGDLHVWKDDFIDWDKIKKIFKNNNCQIIE
jgi:ubiquinone/menaquinone biosynthesis C-methylase UbiE